MVPIDYFDAAADLYLDRTAIIDGDVTVSFRQLRAMSHRVANALAALAPDEPAAAAIYALNDYRVMAVILGIMRAGWGILPLHQRNSVPTNLDLLQQVSPACVFYHASLAADVASMKPHLSSGPRWFELDADSAADPWLEALEASPEPHPSSWIDSCGNANRPVYLWPTSGSTDRPKVVVDTCATFGYTLTSMRAWHRATAPQHVSLIMAPMSHGGGSHGFTILTLGGTLVVTRAFDAGAILGLVTRHRVTDAWLSPTALYLLLDHPDVRRHDLSSLRSLQLGTAAIAPERLREAIGLFGPVLSVTYGQIETGFVTILDADTMAAAAAGHHPERLLSSGTGILPIRVAIMGEDGRPLRAGEEGEIVVRGATVKSYLDPRATAEARRFGWHHTGDLGYLDETGFLYIAGRTRDIVNMAGFKIPAAQVERIIMELPEIQECAVVPAPHPVRGEIVKAVISVRRGQTISAQQIIAHCRQRLGTGKTPANVEQWPELPKSGAGKIDKRGIRLRIASGSP